MQILDGMVIVKMDENYVAVSTDAALDTFSGMVELNQTGYEIWQGIEKGLSAEDIANGFVRDYTDVTFEEALSITQKLINELIESGIVIPD